MHRSAALFVLGVLLVRSAYAEQATTGSSAPGSPAALVERTDLPFLFDGPAAPVAPEVVTRNAEGRATIRAIRVNAPMRIDGRFDEAIYATAPPVGGFIQIEPEAGQPATEKTDVWISFDRNNVYVSLRCWETRPDRIVGNEMRRDNIAVFQGSDHVAFMFDTFYDRRNSVLFEVNPVGGRFDAQVSNERQLHTDWNPLWELGVDRFEGGWTVEAAIPFKSLRYRPGSAQIWGFNVRRGSMWKNEWSFLTRIPNALGPRGIFQASLAATVVGLEAPPGSKNLDIKPYVVSNLTTAVTAVPRILNEVDADAGLDVKYGVTQSLTADFTYNTDFAQAEADEQQINLTRFSLFFPEKREFFLENQGMFGFGGVSPTGGGDTPILFYSRRIGLNQGRAVPIEAGGRLTGRAGRYSVGLLNIHADDEPVSKSRATNFSVVRLKRDLLRRSSVGLIFTGRSVGPSGVGNNAAYGADGTFAFFDNLAINTYWARTNTTSRRGDDVSYRAQIDYAGDRYGLQLEQLAVGSNFNPEVGFVRRDDMRRSFGQFRFSPRPRRPKSVRKFSWTSSLAYIENGDGRVEAREWDGEFAIEFQNSDRFNVGYGTTYEFLPDPFRLATDVVLPVGGYDFGNVRLGFTAAPRRTLSGNVSFEHGAFYDGHRTALAISRGRVNLQSQLSLEPTYSINWVDLVEGSFTTHLIGSRVTYTMTPLMFTTALLQYNSGSHSVFANVRLRWEYRPGSELFVVYNEDRDTLARRFPALANRAVIVKVNRLFRF